MAKQRFDGAPESGGGFLRPKKAFSHAALGVWWVSVIHTY